MTGWRRESATEALSTGPTGSRAAERAPMAGLDWLLLCAAGGIWGSSFLFMEVALRVEDPGLVAWLRPALGLGFLVLLPSARQPVDRVDLPVIALLGLVWMAVPLSLFPLAQTWIDSSIAGMLNSAMPVATLAVGSLFFGVRTHRVQLTGVAVGVVGIFMVGLPTASGGRTGTIGIGLVLVAICCYGLAANIAGPLQRRYGSASVLLRVLIVATVATTPWGLVGLTRSTFAWSAVGANLALGAGGTGVAYVAAATLLGRVGPVRMSAVTYVVPVVAALLGAIALGERFGAWEVVGLVVLLGGAWMTTRSAGDRAAGDS